MSEPMTFAEVVAIANEEGDRFTGKGLEALFDIFEHIYNGGRATNCPKWAYEEIAVLLGVCWADMQRSVSERQ